MPIPQAVNNRILDSTKCQSKTSPLPARPRKTPAARKTFYLATTGKCEDRLYMHVVLDIERTGVEYCDRVPRLENLHQESL